MDSTTVIKRCASLLSSKPCRAPTGCGHQPESPHCPIPDLLTSLSPHTHACHTGLLSVPLSRQPHCCLRALPPALPLSWNAPPLEVDRNGTFPARPLSSTVVKIAACLPHGPLHPPLPFPSAPPLATLGRLVLLITLTVFPVPFGHPTPGSREAREGRDVVWSA